ncbi:MAG: L,D-transpeptidase [Proteobacteria bacterium]|nr:L,D-transpeptidase [Pseudomonadota bacterium]MDE3207294.1 L,D-transpeptidase [Pseudomonadota bacterium]
MKVNALFRSVFFILSVLKMEPVLAQPLQVTRILILKSLHTMYLYAGKQVVESYPVALGWNPVGRKIESGDGRTPEGSYIIDGRNAHSHYDLSLRISYPNLADQARARRFNVNPGGGIYIHGIGYDPSVMQRARSMKNWTAGCIAVTNAQIHQIWSLVPLGTPVTIRP